MKSLFCAELTTQTLTFLAFQLQKIATNVSECIAGIICSSTNEEFQEECAAILQLPLQNLEEIETTIRTRMFNIIQQQDGQKKRKPRGEVSEVFANEFVHSEDEEELLNYVNEDEEPLYYDNEDEELLWGETENWRILVKIKFAI